MGWSNIAHIRSMPEETLVDFLYEHFTCKSEGGNCPVEGCNSTDCKKHIEKWLYEERKED